MGNERFANVEAWRGPVVTVASMCQHIDGERHRLVVLDLEPLVRELSAYVDGPVAAVPLGGIRVGSFGIVLQGFAAIDVLAVTRNIVWEDEHCLTCCGALMRFVEPLQHKVLTRCGPTIGARSDGVRSVVDEYWTD